eukprot:scaffold51660_cov37-Phaeocystis_antarctica.AAC.1
MLTFMLLTTSRPNLQKVFHIAGSCFRPPKVSSCRLRSRCLSALQGLHLRPACATFDSLARRAGHRRPRLKPWSPALLNSELLRLELRGQLERYKRLYVSLLSGFGRFRQVVVLQGDLPFRRSAAAAFRRSAAAAAVAAVASIAT